MSLPDSPTLRETGQMDKTEGLQLRVAAITHRGLSRPRNEDAFMLGELVCQGATMASALPIQVKFVLSVGPGVSRGAVLAVSDGLGGHAAGEIASRLSLDCLAAAWSGAPAETAGQVKSFWVATLENAHLAIVRFGSLRPEWTRMAATVVGIHLHAGWGAVTFHAGDSRAYRFRQGILKLLTSDHSQAEIAQRSQPKGGDPVRTSLAVWKCLGSSSKRLDPSVQLAAPALQPGDRFLLATDGLSDMITVDSAEMILSAQPDTAEAAVALLTAALAAGGTDNVTLVLADVLGAGLEAIEAGETARATAVEPAPEAPPELVPSRFGEGE
jgi:serine/threonine protein phosphatase PrpC